MKLYESSSEPWQPTQGRDRQIAVLMSGGVDSSVTAHLLRAAGWDVLGVTMKIPVCHSPRRGCCGADAAYISAQLGIAHHFVDVTASFRQCIIDPFRDAYRVGRTPNPCIDCNTDLKFAAVWDLIKGEFGIQYVATGHYARVQHDGDHAYLARGLDKSKDQSYFLYGIKRERLPYFVLPLGGLEKSHVREIAMEIKLGVAQKPESMELCFAGEADYRNALDDEQRHQPGRLTDMQGKALGEHQGIANYTLGQRKGLGYAGGKPLYVGRIDPDTNTVALGTRDEVTTPYVTAEAINLLAPKPLEVGQALGGKIRSYSDPEPCHVEAVDEDRITVAFDDPVFAPTPGQRLVLYDAKDRVLAGGTICRE
ncbi:tRNA 2-thiouridine(34) synthase MnmA [Planctomycetota bacterium]